MDLSFNCGENSYIGNENSLCFFDSLCKINNITLENYCECNNNNNDNDYYIYDNTYFFSKSCIPYFIVYLPFFGNLPKYYIIYKLYKLYFQTKSYFKKICFWTILASFGFSLIPFGLAIQQGFHEIASIGTFFGSVCFNICGTYMIISVLIPAYKCSFVDNNIIENEVKKAWIILFINILLYLPLLISGFIYDYNLHNNVFFFGQALLLGAGILHPIYNFYSFNKLEKVIKNVMDNNMKSDVSSINEDLKENYKKVNKTKLYLGMFAFNNMISIIFITTIIFLFKSFPYQWIMIFVLQGTLIGGLSQIPKLVTNNKNNTSSNKNVLSNNYSSNSNTGTIIPKESP